DPFLDAATARKLEVELLPLDDLLARADVITFHTPLTKESRNLLNRERIARMKKGALVVNCGRGGVIDEEALLEALESGHLGGAALDVFAEEPPKDLRLVRHKRVVATPHLGAQTREAQERISIETAQMVLAALSGSLAVAAVNLPFRPTGGRAEPFMTLGETLGRMAGGLIGGPLQKLRVDVSGIDEALCAPVAVAVLKGVLTPFMGEDVNYVNAEQIARSRGIEVARSVRSAPGEYPNLVEVALSGGDRDAKLAGTVFGDHDLRVVRFEDYPLEFRPEGKLLVLENHDKPGVVGKIGTLLAEADVNIADIHLARRGQEAVAVLRLDQEPSEEVVEKLSRLPEVKSARRVLLG
ncbi:MAG TPA: NAD(P)-dependent oxidoreductase, partial [Gemmatimonadales bacterium]|nr:NAD(P)-dependent oxidoreductase [Gemmatimonadales bacterium]